MTDPTRRRRWQRYALLVAVLAALASSLTVTAALADDLVGNARFTSPGVRIFDDGAVGVGCTVFGMCNGATVAALSGNATTRKRSDRAGEPVVADCTVNDLVRVHTFAATGGADDTLTGWASAHSIAAPRLLPC